jgi:probable F420-dependent oxidoreductase
MRFGLALSGVSPRHYASLAQQAETAGFESVWVPDHLVFPEVMPASYLYTDTGEPPIPSTTAAYDPWVLLGAIASVTETIRLGTNVYVLPLRHPIAVARSVLTVDRISRGRVTLGAGVGWLKEEFGVIGLDATNRGKRTDEMIGLLRRLWTDPVVEHHGDYYDIPAVYFEPKPFQRPIPIETGGSSPAALRRAGRLGDGWIEIGSRDQDELGAKLKIVHAERAAAGREDLPFLVTVGIDADVTVDDVADLATLGVDRVVVRVPAATTDAGALSEFVQGFADKTISIIRTIRELVPREG